jgi:DUF971 family protein
LSAADTGAASVGAAAEAVMPERVALRDRGRELRLRWPDGLEATLGAAKLRNACRCATCTHLRRSGARVQIHVEITLEQALEFGVAGLQLVFSDGHRRGIFPWEYLRQLAARAD